MPMAKLYRPKFNSWLTTLVLVSIGLHGLVLALPMPSLEPPAEIEAVPDDPDVIQVVTLPKLATAPESPQPPPPEPLPEPPPPEPPPVDDIVITDPEILEEPDYEEEPETPESPDPENEERQ